jgi:hypothetical protein
MRGNLGRDDTAFPFAVVFTVVGLCVGLIGVVLGLGFGGSTTDEIRGDLDGTVVFVGSSTIARFPLDEVFPGKRCTNLGMGNETAPDLRERLERTLPATVRPAGIVLYAGSADLRFHPRLTAGEIRVRVEAVVAELRRKAPEAPMVLLEVLPGRRQFRAEHAGLRALNAELAALAAERGLVLVRTNRPPLVDEHGDLLDAMSVDSHHLGLDGYRVLGRWIREDGGAIGEALR